MLEATGGLERLLLFARRPACATASGARPARKKDAQDARLLARFAERVAQKLLDEQQMLLCDSLVRHERVCLVITAINLLARLPQLGFKNPKEICGVTPTRAVRAAKPDTSTAVDRT